MQTTQQNNNEYRSVPLTALQESTTNPRRRFDEEHLRELAASFKSQGILAPLLVRELDKGKYEVVAGARRLRAAKLAELEAVPVRVVQLSDGQAMEAQVIENLQREDIDRLPHMQVAVLAKRHKLDIEKPGQVPQQIIAKHAGTYDEEGLCRMLLEISLLDSAYQRNGSGGDDSLVNTAKRYRVDAEKIATSVARKMAAKRKRQETKAATKKATA